MPGIRFGTILQRLFVIASLACCLVVVCSGNAFAEADGPDTRKIIDIFGKISQTPRCSKDEGRISAWLVNWARERNLAVKTDATGNVIISVPGYQGRENEPPVALQAHIDMVCAKTVDSTHDFTKDPITMIRDGQWLRADRTTLGADDGIGVAIALFLASEPGIDRPPLELVFTTDEEVDMTGAAGLAPGAITARRLVNLDWETEGSVALGAAGGIKMDISLPMPFVVLQDEWEVYKLEISGLLGGHSGLAMGKNRANANVLAARALEGTAPVRVIAFDGGTADNAIAPSAAVTLAVAGKDADALKARVSAFGLTLRRDYPEEKGLRLSLARQQATPSAAASSADSKSLISLILDIPQDVHEWSTRFPGLPETSNNIGMVNLVSGAARLKVFHRSFNPKKLEAFAQRVEGTASKAGAASMRRSAFPTWPPDPESALYKQSLVSYEKELRSPLETHVVHAGLECGFIAEKYPGIEIISLGPTLLDVHTPTERLHLPSVEKVVRFMRRLLKDL